MKGKSAVKKMKSEEFTKCVLSDNGEKLVYQLIESEAVFNKYEDYPRAYSIIILNASGESVIQSELLYDISRIRENGIDLLNKLCDSRITPENARRAIEIYI